LRKSFPRPADWAAGDSAKYLSYAEAWARIRDARRQGYFLEAVTVQESIISDRLSSFLVKECGMDPESKKLRVLQQVVGEWSKQARSRLSEGSVCGSQVDVLQHRIDLWRDARNRVVHGLVKSKASRGEDHIDDFLKRAAVAAQDGEELARRISRWVEAARRELAQSGRDSAGLGDRA
jgi:hypothetical protein